MSYIQTGKTIEIQLETVLEYPEAEIICDVCKKIMGKHIVKPMVAKRMICTVRHEEQMGRTDLTSESLVRESAWGELCSVECVAEFARKNGFPEKPT